MATANTRRRIHPDMTPSQKRRAVRALLRELSAALAAARRAGREVPWPAAPAAAPGDPIAASAAV